MGLTTFQERLKTVVDFSGFSIRKFALECGMKQSTFDKHIRGTAEPNIATLIAIGNRFHEISMDWLILGEGNMLKAELVRVEAVNKYLETIDALNDAITAQGNTIKLLKERIKELESK